MPNSSGCEAPQGAVRLVTNCMQLSIESDRHNGTSLNDALTEVRVREHVVRARRTIACIASVRIACALFVVSCVNQETLLEKDSL